MSKYAKESTALKITVEGVVQGVGFRPFIYNLAHSLGLTGYVRNTDTGVVIFIQGNNPQQFIHEMHKQLPPLAELKEVKAETTKTVHGLKDFSIQASEDRGGFTLISPDISVCNDCIQEMETPGDRRYLYPFINCTNCGPRYSITEKVPYDRPNTTMKSFRMCPECEKEYHDPSNRRFHAQPNACPECGPQVSLHIIPSKITPVDQGNAIPSAIQLLSKGAIVAIKGIGGFHIACDAENSDAVTRLRERKRRSNKPFALMTKDITSIEKYCIVTEKEKKLLLSPRRPIVLLRKQDRYNDAFPLISPGNSTIGFMLPYTPLHRLLFSHHGKGYRYLVMTSGNLSEEPIISSNEEALEKLSSIVDAFLFHNRDIYMAVDDSVAFLPEVHGGGSRAVLSAGRVDMSQERSSCILRALM